MTASLLDSDLLPPLAELLGGFADLDGDEEPAADAATVERVTVSLPFELEMWRQGAALDLRASPPTQKIETTILPVWHRLTVTIALEEEADADAGS
jgi:hypothetical protein